MVLPSVPCNKLNLAKSPWKPPFVPLILANPENRLKAYVTAGTTSFSVSLLDKYEPCSIDAFSVSGCISSMLDYVGREITVTLVRPPTYQTGTVNNLDLQSQSHDLDDLIFSNCSRYDSLKPLACGQPQIPPMQMGIYVPPSRQLPDQVLREIVCDTAFWQLSTLSTFVDPYANPGETMVKSKDVKLKIIVEEYSQVRAIGSAVSAHARPFSLFLATRQVLTVVCALQIRTLLVTNGAFAATNFHIDIPTEAPFKITSRQAESFMRIVQGQFVTAGIRLWKEAERTCGSICLNMGNRDMPACRPGKSRLRCMKCGKDPNGDGMFYAFRETGSDSGPVRKFYEGRWAEESSDAEGESSYAASVTA
jgi:hypothetical protein